MQYMGSNKKFHMTTNQHSWKIDGLHCSHLMQKLGLDPVALLGDADLTYLEHWPLWEGPGQAHLLTAPTDQSSPPQLLRLCPCCQALPARADQMLQRRLS